MVLAIQDWFRYLHVPGWQPLEFFGSSQEHVIVTSSSDNTCASQSLQYSIHMTLQRGGAGISFYIKTPRSLILTACGLWLV